MERIKQALEKARETRHGHVTTKAERPRALRRAVPQADKPIDVEYTETRVLHLDPAVLEENRIVAHNKADPRCMHFDVLRTQVLKQMRKNGWRTLAITSPTPGCGKSVNALNLALSLSHRTSETVLLADFDLRKPSIAKYLGLPEGPSLLDYLDGDAPLSELLVNPGLPRIVILPNFQPIQNASETLASERFSELLSEIRDRYADRTVIIDLPPILSLDDALVITPKVDCTLLVVASGQSKSKEVKDSLRLLKDTNFLGCVMNKADTPLRNYYYYQSSGYS